MAEFSYGMLYRYNQIYAQGGVVPFEKALMLLRERMQSKKLLLKQRGVPEAFVSGRDTFVSLPTNYAKNCCHGCISIAYILLRRVL